MNFTFLQVTFSDWIKAIVAPSFSCSAETRKSFLVSATLSLPFFSDLLGQQQVHLIGNMTSQQSKPTHIVSERLSE